MQQAKQKKYSVYIYLYSIIKWAKKSQANLS